MKQNEPKNSDNDKEDEEPMYYMENGLMVFTRAFHLKRGYCCRSGCRHCPYGFEGEKKKEVKDQP